MSDTYVMQLHRDHATAVREETDLELPEQGCSEATVLEDLELPDLVEADADPGWNPRETASGALNADQQAQALALHNAVRGRPHRDFVYDVNQMALAGGKVGNKYHTADFAVACEKFANDDLEKVTQQSLQIILPGLGVKSDLEGAENPPLGVNDETTGAEPQAKRHRGGRAARGRLSRQLRLLARR